VSARRRAGAACAGARASTVSGQYGRRDEACPVSTGGGTRRVQSVREGGRGVSSQYGRGERRVQSVREGGAACAGARTSTHSLRPWSAARSRNSAAAVALGGVPCRMRAREARARSGRGARRHRRRVAGQDDGACLAKHVAQRRVVPTPFAARIGQSLGFRVPAAVQLRSGRGAAAVAERRASHPGEQHRTGCASGRSRAPPPPSPRTKWTPASLTPY
jgi:hypothetical protein